MCLAIVSAIIMAATTVICCPFIRQYCQTNKSEDIVKHIVDKTENDCNEKTITHLQEIKKIIIKPDVKEESAKNSITNICSSTKIGQNSTRLSIPEKPPRVFKQSHKKEEIAKTRELNKDCQDKLTINCNLPKSSDNDRFLTLVNETLAITNTINKCLESCGKTGLQTMTIELKNSNGSVLVSNELQKEISVFGSNIDSAKSISQIPELKLPKIIVTNSRTNLSNLQHNHSLINAMTIEDNDTNYIDLPITRTKFTKHIRKKEKNKDYLQSTKCSKYTHAHKNLMFKRLRKCFQPLSVKFKQFFCNQ